MSNYTVATVGNVLELDKLREEIRTKLINDALEGKLDITNPTLVTILQDAYKTTIASEPKPALEPKLLEHKGEVLCLIEFAGKIISGGADGAICAWDPTNLTSSNRFGSHTKGSVNCFVVADGYLYSGTDGEVNIWNSTFQLVKTITFDDVGEKSKVTQMFVHHGVVEVGFESGIIKSIYRSGFYKLNFVNQPLKHSIRNFIPLGGRIYVCTTDVIYKLNEFCSKIELIVEDTRDFKYEWTHIRLIEGELYVFDGRGDVYKITDDKIDNRLSISEHTSSRHLWVSEYANDNLYIGLANGRVNKFAGSPKKYTGYSNYDVCVGSYLKCSVKAGNKLYIGCTAGHVHTLDL